MGVSGQQKLAAPSVVRAGGLVTLGVGPQTVVYSFPLQPKGEHHSGG